LFCRLLVNVLSYCYMHPLRQQIYWLLPLVRLLLLAFFFLFLLRGLSDEVQPKKRLLLFRRRRPLLSF
jgi:hypothetical protein